AGWLAQRRHRWDFRGTARPSGAQACARTCLAASEPPCGMVGAGRDQARTAFARPAHRPALLPDLDRPGFRTRGALRAVRLRLWPGQPDAAGLCWIKARPGQASQHESMTTSLPAGPMHAESLLRRTLLAFALL